MLPRSHRLSRQLLGLILLGAYTVAGVAAVRSGFAAEVYDRGHQLVLAARALWTSL